MSCTVLHLVSVKALGLEIREPCVSRNMGLGVSVGSDVFFFAVAPPGLFRPDVVPQTFFVIV